MIKRQYDFLLILSILARSSETKYPMPSLYPLTEFHTFPLNFKTYEGPKVRAEFSPCNVQNFKVRLFTSNTFTFSFSESLPIDLVQSLLTWQKAYSLKQNFPWAHTPRQNLPSFSQEVLTNLNQVPFGSTISYSSLAALSKNPKAARAVGTIYRLNPWPLLIPCHRVITQQGHIGRYAFGEEIKKALLAFELRSH